MNLKNFITRASIIFLFLFLLACGVTLGVIYSSSQDLPNVDALNRFEPYLATEIYASDGQLLGRVFSENRILLGWKEIPTNIKHAIVATEDSRFYSHFGIDIRGIFRAAIADLLHHGAEQGGSTITQQLARNLFLSPQVSLKRKLKEALLAIEIERRFSKDEILELYLNLVYFGAGAYGIESASQTYFGESAKNLDLAQASLLAGLPQAPSAYNPFSNLPAAKKRQKEVLERMYEQHYISKRDRNAAYAEPLHFAAPKDQYTGLAYPYFTTAVIAKLFEKYPADLVYKGGLHVYTTLDVGDQQFAENALKKELDRGKKENMHAGQGALVAMEPRTGYVKAMVGGYEFSKSNQFNRAWQARRQPGSSFKIFVYSCALENGFDMDTTVIDAPISFPSGQGAWSPRNDDGRFWGAMPLRKALAYSRNVVAVRVAAKIGIDKVIEYAHKMGVDEPLDPYLPTAIGASVVTPMEMLTAVGTLANEGVRVNPVLIKKILDRNGNVIEDNENPPRIEAIGADTARKMTNVMQDVIKYGTGTRANIGRPAAGKTGTTSDFRDSWFVGFTPDLACVVWIGNDDFTPMKEAYGGYLPAMTWADYMKHALKDVPVHDFTLPDELLKKKSQEPSPSPTPEPSPKKKSAPSPSPSATEEQMPPPSPDETPSPDESQPGDVKNL